MTPSLSFFALLIAASSGKKVPIPASGPACTDQITFDVKDSGLIGIGYPYVVEVFGIPLLTTEKFANATEGGKNKLQHVASILAELLDNDNDGCADDPNVLAQLLKPLDKKTRKTFLLLNKQGDDSEEQVEQLSAAGYMRVQIVKEDETHPTCSGLDMTGECRDSTVEEALHLVTHWGHAHAHKKVLGTTWEEKSALTKAMDEARGKRMKKTPNEISKYPEGAWFTYDDGTCDYGCQALEYLWWGYAAYTGAGNGLASGEHYSAEFHVLKQDDFKAKDLALTKIFDDSESGVASYRLPTKIVDGIYTGCKACGQVGGISHGGN